MKSTAVRLIFFFGKPRIYLFLNLKKLINLRNIVTESLNFLSKTLFNLIRVTQLYESSSQWYQKGRRLQTLGKVFGA